MISDTRTNIPGNTYVPYSTGIVRIENQKSQQKQIGRYR